MKIGTKKCVFNHAIQDWVLDPVMIEVNSITEFKAALAAFESEVQRYRGKARKRGRHDGQS